MSIASSSIPLAFGKGACLFQNIRRAPRLAVSKPYVSAHCSPARRERFTPRGAVGVFLVFLEKRPQVNFFLPPTSHLYSSPRPPFLCALLPLHSPHYISGHRQPLPTSLLTARLPALRPGNLGRNAQSRHLPGSTKFGKHSTAALTRSAHNTN